MLYALTGSTGRLGMLYHSNRIMFIPTCGIRASLRTISRDSVRIWWISRSKKLQKTNFVLTSSRTKDHFTLTSSSCFRHLHAYVITRTSAIFIRELHTNSCLRHHEFMTPSCWHHHDFIISSCLLLMTYMMFRVYVITTYWCFRAYIITNYYLCSCIVKMIIADEYVRAYYFTLSLSARSQPGALPLGPGFQGRCPRTPVMCGG